MTLRHDIDKLARRITPAERWAAERMVGVFTNGFIIVRFGGPAHLLPAEHAYAAWKAVWARHRGFEPEPLGYQLFCLGMRDRGYRVTRAHGTDWLASAQLNIPALVFELTGGITSDSLKLYGRLRHAADELAATRAA